MSDCANNRNGKMNEGILRNICELEWEKFFKGERASINALKQAYNYVARKNLFKKIVDMFRNKNLTIDNFMKYDIDKINLEIPKINIPYRLGERIKIKSLKQLEYSLFSQSPWSSSEYSYRPWHTQGLGGLDFYFDNFDKDSVSSFLSKALQAGQWVGNRIIFSLPVRNLGMD